VVWPLQGGTHLFVHSCGCRMPADCNCVPAAVVCLVQSSHNPRGNFAHVFDRLLQLAPTWVKLASRFNRTNSVVVAKVLNTTSCVCCHADDSCLLLLITCFVRDGAFVIAHPCTCALSTPNVHMSPLQIEAQANEHEALKVDGFPGIFLYPSGKDQTPIPYAGYDRSLKVHRHCRTEAQPSANVLVSDAKGSSGCSMHPLRCCVYRIAKVTAAA
jgi:hypothetical protein